MEPFCRTPPHASDEEVIERRTKLIEKDNVIAIYNQGNHYRGGTCGYPQDYTKALELWHRAAAELGHVMAYSNIGYAYYNGEGVEVDEKKASRYYELAAMLGMYRQGIILAIWMDV